MFDRRVTLKQPNSCCRDCRLYSLLPLPSTMVGSTIKVVRTDQCSSWLPTLLVVSLILIFTNTCNLEVTCPLSNKWSVMLSKTSSNGPSRYQYWIVGPFPQAIGGYEYLYVPVNKFTKWTKVEVVNKVTTTTTI